jgi:hypothetical protein
MVKTFAVYLYYIWSELKNTARPAQVKTNHQTFDM